MLAGGAWLVGSRALTLTYATSVGHLAWFGLP